MFSRVRRRRATDITHYAPLFTRDICFLRGLFTLLMPHAPPATYYLPPGAIFQEMFVYQVHIRLINTPCCRRHEEERHTLRQHESGVRRETEERYDAVLCAMPPRRYCYGCRQRYYTPLKTLKRRVTKSEAERRYVGCQ